MRKYRYGRPKTHKLDLLEIETWLPSIGFTVEKITQEWRHVIAFGAYQGVPAVLKMACTQVTGKHTRNEKRWNEAVHLTDPKSHPHFMVPKVYTEGQWHKLYYFICDWYTGRPLARLQSFDEQRVLEWLPIVAKVSREIELLQFPSDCEFVSESVSVSSPKIPMHQKILLSSREWASQVSRDLSQLTEYLETVKSMSTAPAHGDFVLRQMFELGTCVGLIDGEHAGARGALHYDVAQMYIRLISDHNQWELARDYLLLFRDQLPKEEKACFWQDLKPPLIQRYIGDLWGSKNNPANLDRLMPLADMIIKDRVI